MQLLAVGIDKHLKSWAVNVEVEKLEDLCPEKISADLYRDEKSHNTLPTSIALIKIEDGAAVLHNSYRFVDDDWETLDVEPGQYPRARDSVAEGTRSTDAAGVVKTQKLSEVECVKE